MYTSNVKKKLKIFEFFFSFSEFHANFLLSFQRFPFDSTNPICFGFAFSLEYIMMLYIVQMSACIISMGFGAYTFIIALTEDIKIGISTINYAAKTQADRLEIVEQISNFIEIHLNAKQLSESIYIEAFFLN